MAKRLSMRGIKKHQTYTVEEAALILRVHPQTVRAWGKDGLPIMRGQKPHLVHGDDLRTYVSRRAEARKKPLEAGEVFCLKCRTGVRPAGDLADVAPTSSGGWHLSGICPRCEGMAQRFVSTAQLHAISTVLAIAFKGGEESLTGPTNPPSNPHKLGKDAP